MKSSFTAALLVVLGPTMAHAATIGDYVDSCGFRFALVDCRAGCVTTQTTAADSGVGFDLDFKNTSVDSTTVSMELSLGFAVEAIGRADPCPPPLFTDDADSGSSIAADPCGGFAVMSFVA